MPQPFPHLFQPLTLRHVTLKHRLTFGAHTANMSRDGLPADRHLGYYLERAIGGAAMIVVEPVPAHRTAVLTRGNFRHSDDAVVPQSRRITEACHEHGAVMIQQIYHVGAHGDWDNSFEPNWSPAGLPSMHDSDGSHAMTGAEIEEVVEGFAQAQPDVLSLADQQEIAAWHDARGLYDYVTVGTGSYYDFTRIIPAFLYEDKLGPPFAEAIKRVVRHARVQAESHIRTPENADYVIAAGQADMVSIVRGQIADPHMATKAAAGRPEDIRPCISCNQMCGGRRSRDYWISCLVNPSVGRESQWGGDRFAPAARPRRVLVVGGGPAGLEAARVAAERGHRVTLAEAADRLGGQFRLAGEQPRRAQILDLIAWYEGQLERLQVVVRLNAPMDAGEVRGFGADAVVLATRSPPGRAGFPRARPRA